ncbi:hypothetical protein NBRC3188_2974 [Acetobacter pasteurianus NBRC 3188]|uniref:Uncharacterized protein n=1 Tax=Acetobacter pasteurianus NBRC 3188 TaxID=1226663 RepID=A0A401WY59_ACEPA|nr:hypothetical protein NBRC3188_2974 [Acetobacter pasteurianus NBRC 3188]
MDQKIAPLILPVKEAAARDANVRAVVNRLHSGGNPPIFSGVLTENSGSSF